MKKAFPAVLLVTMATVCSAFSPAGPPAARSAGDTREAGVSGESGREEVALTIYNNNLGLVREVRRIELPRGVTTLEFADVAAHVDPATVLVRPLDDPTRFRVIEQNYEYDLLDPQKLMDKYVGKMVTLRVNGAAPIRARLLSTNGGPIYEIEGEIHMGHVGQVVLPGIPGDLISRPTLVWRLDNQGAETRRLQASYLTTGMSWKADYVLSLGAGDDRADLSAWVTLDNKSGATYRDATLKLVAGDVNRARRDEEMRGMMMKAASMDAARESSFQEEGFFEYHLYALDGRTTVKDNQTKQISLLSATDVPVAKKLVYYGAASYYRGQFGSPIANQKIGVFLEVDNRKANHLGIPIPKGVVRVYKADSQGSMQFVGEDSIDHTPRDETMRIKMGDAFDVVGERLQTDYRVLGDSTYETAWRITLRNHKEEPVTVSVIEPIPGDWSVIESSHPYVKSEAHTLQYEIRIPANGKTEVTYRTRMRF